MDVGSINPNEKDSKMKNSDAVAGCQFIVLLVWFVFAVLFLFRGLLTNEQTAIDALESRGYTEIEVHDKDVFFVGFRGGDQMDAAIFNCSAKNRHGKEARFDVTMGWPFKGSTVRTP